MNKVKNWFILALILESISAVYAGPVDVLFFPQAHNTKVGHNNLIIQSQLEIYKGIKARLDQQPDLPIFAEDLFFNFDGRCRVSKNFEDVLAEKVPPYFFELLKKYTPPGASSPTPLKVPRSYVELMELPDEIIDFASDFIKTAEFTSIYDGRYSCQNVLKIRKAFPTGDVPDVISKEQGEIFATDGAVAVLSALGKAKNLQLTVDMTGAINYLERIRQDRYEFLSPQQKKALESIFLLTARELEVVSRIEKFANGNAILVFGSSHEFENYFPTESGSKITVAPGEIFQNVVRIGRILNQHFHKKELISAEQLKLLMAGKYELFIYIYAGISLVDAAKDGLIEVVHYLLDHGANTSQTDKAGNDALMIAANRGSLRMVLDLLKHSVAINAQNQTGETALMMAANRGIKPIVNSLLKHGAKINIQNQAGETALMKAYRNKQADIVAAIREWSIFNKVRVTNPADIKILDGKDPGSYSRDFSAAIMSQAPTGIFMPKTESSTN